MVRSLKARYEGGVLHPLTDPGLREGDMVEVSLAPVGWDERLRALLTRMRQHGMSADEIEQAITEADAEGRAERAEPH
jgi:predicted DNA-binding antitoxin AbrB/MazE fold protein